jgi:PAS domain S-box-containing protein
MCRVLISISPLRGRVSATTFLAWLILLLCPAVSIRADEPAPKTPKRILLLHDYGQEAAGRAILDQSFQSVLNSAPRGSIEFHSETLEIYRFPGESHIALMRDYLRQKYAGIKFDVIVVVFDAPLEFLLRYRKELFPDVPIVYLILKHPNLAALPPATTGLWEGPRVKDSLEIALKLHPDTRQVFVIRGKLNNTLDETETFQQLEYFKNKIDINYLIDLPLDELTARVRNLPPHSIVLCPQQNIGVGGRSIPPYEAAGLIAQASNAPVYGIVETWVGGGIFGGEVVSLEETGTELATRALRIVNGARPEDMAVQEAPTVPMFDWRQLRRFQVSEASLPAGSVVRFKEFTFWELYKGRIIAVLTILILQTLLLAALLFERARKRRATRRLAESEERFAKAFKANPQPMSLTTIDGGMFLDVNESFLLMSGYSRDEVIGHTTNELRLLETAARRDEIVAPILRDGVVRNFELKFRTKAGQFRTLLSSAEIIELAGEKCILVASTDITERKELEQELERSEREFSTLVEHSPDVIARLDLDLRYIYISPGLERATGVSTDHFIGKTAPEVALEGYDSQTFEAICREAISTMQPTSRAFDFGDRHYWTRVVPEFAPDGAVESVMTISEDVTDRIRAQEELLQLTAQLFRSQDQERRRIARELHDGTAQNLFGISINLARLNQLSQDQPEAKRLIDECETLGNESLQEIRTLSYLLHPPLLDEAGLVSALQWYVQGFSKRSGIYVDVFAPAMDRLPSDMELALFRIVQESLTNVRRHSGSGTASIRLEKKSNEVVLEIQDKGRGMPAAKTSDEPNDLVEMGVGIPGMRQRMVQLGGKLEVISNSHGTTITAVVPLTNGEHHVANPSRGRS